ncbi:MAG: TAT-variant-translocated molybdopterin oxidoreductase [Archangium sp.]|nr:TAT-variant-translocated molybdopterin oxidoreductase [Archangium sp.]
MKKDPYAPIRDQMNETPEFWRSLEHQRLDDSVKTQVESEFPAGVTMPTGFNRRDAMKIAGASLALGSLAGCEKLRRDPDEILPFVKSPEKYVPGNKLMYATAQQRSEGAIGILAEANEGRPTKLEGNPATGSGASDIWAQAEVLKLYDPERARSPLKGGTAAKWEDFDAFAKDHFGKLVAAQGAGLAFLVEEDMGPTFERLLAKLPQAKVVRFDPLSPDNALQGAQIAFGPGARQHVDISKAKVVFSLDSDFLVSGPDHLAHAAAFGKTRAVDSAADAAKMIRLYVAESVFSTTGTNADHRVRMSAGEGLSILKALGAALGLGGEAAQLTDAQKKFVDALAKDLNANKGASVIMVGERQGAAVHALAAQLNAGLTNLGATVTVSFSDDKAARVSMYEQLDALVKAADVTTLVSFEANPLYTAPASYKFGDFVNGKTWVHAGVLPEESGLKATWHVPTAHFLEAWGDARAWNGTASIVQPIILPLHGGRPGISLLASLVGETETSDKKLVEATWAGKLGKAPGGDAVGGLDVKAWRKALHDGVIAGSARAAGTAELKTADITAAVAAAKSWTATKDALDFIAVEGHFKDGRLSNVSWLMELPDSMSKLCWDNALLISPTLAKELNIESAVKKNAYVSDIVEITVDGRTLKAPTFVVPGIPTYSVVMNRGYGRTWGEIASGTGVDAHALLGPSGSVAAGAKVSKTNTTTDLASTQDHFTVPGNPFRELTFAQMTNEPAGAAERNMGLATRGLFRSASASEYKKDGAKFAREGDMPEKLVQLGTPKNRPSKPIQPTTEITYEGQQWGMVIDLSSCIGCNICAIACIAENNIPVVGREQVLLGREMHWIRVDRYFTGDIDTPRAVHQPLNCMHCENAPCEPVCPVGATTHDEEGINSMAYNRCIGTRYCANNCPYKVRRYNYLDFTHTGDFVVAKGEVFPFKDKTGKELDWKERYKTLKLQRNPDVTVRYRGVMEKCTYCVQRIDEAKIAAKRAGNDRKKLPDGAVTPACAQACPTSAITFGNINDLESRVAKLKQSERNYELLQELNVRPRTTYLARVRNENEELA